MPREGAIRGPMQPYWTQPTTYADPRVFDMTRYSADNLTFWASHLIRIGQMSPSTPLLDLGCGTGGFTLALQALTGARVVGVDIALRLLQYAAQKPASQGLGWVQGHAAALPFPEATFARVLISLALHQFPDRARALTEVARILQPRGLLIIRTITPEAAQQRIPPSSPSPRPSPPVGARETTEAVAIPSRQKTYPRKPPGGRGHTVRMLHLAPMSITGEGKGGLGNLLCHSIVLLIYSWCGYLVTLPL